MARKIIGIKVCYFLIKIFLHVHLELYNIYSTQVPRTP